MPRPRKCRRVCRLPDNTGFRPVRCAPDAPTVILTVDEYEALRLIDKEGFSQEECGAYMRIARTTVQQIYTVARKKLAEALVEGLPLRIEGGEYQLCDGTEEYCGCGGCRRHRRSCGQEKGGTPMKIAIPLDDTKQEVCVSFGRAPYFLIQKNGTAGILENPAAQAQGGAGFQAAQFVVDQGADTLITVRCGENAAQVFQAAGIRILKAEGVSAQENLEKCESGGLAELTHFHAGFHGIG